MSNQNSSQDRNTDIAAEFVEFGQNIKKALQSAWASEDRKMLQEEIEKGLKDAGEALKQASSDFSHSQAAQTLKSEAEDFHKRVKSGEFEDKVRSEVLAALRMANEQLKKAFSSGAASESRSAQPPVGPEEK
jgi:hypothetical protein